MTGPTFSGNSAGTDGGALFNLGTMTVSGTLTDNTAEYDGGAVYNQGLMTILSSTLNGNTGQSNGAPSATVGGHDDGGLLPRSPTTTPPRGAAISSGVR